MIISNIDLDTAKQKCYVSLGKENKFSIISNLLTKMKKVEIDILGKSNHSFKVAGHVCITQLSDEYLRVFLNKKDDSLYGLFISGMPFVSLDDDYVIGSMTVPGNRKILVFEDGGIIRMKMSTKLKYFVLHPRCGWVDVTSVYEKGLGYHYFCGLINESI